MRLAVWLAVILALAAPAAGAGPLRPKPRPAAVAVAATPHPLPRPAPPAAAPLLWAGVAATIRPLARPVLPAMSDPPFGAAMAAVPVPLASTGFPRPRSRPATLAAAAAAAALPLVAVVSPGGRPKARPKGLDLPEEVIPAAFVRARPVPEATQPRKGSVCGDRRIRGETIPPITSRIAGCGVKDPVKVTEVDGVRLSTPITVDCPTAEALTAWVRRVLKPAFGGKDVAALRIADSYSCRPRNNVRGNKISEHGKGKAVDISAVLLADGTMVDVLDDYAGRKGKPLRVAHKGACGIFGTTLGPGSDGYHENHLHFDTSNMNRPYCR